ncbi:MULTISPECIES: hypothetical protein [unclassified Phenylobacterium]|uniref:hypothetical protein n=1 Tax=unclassified Phenylobacterium TaxID=2640670 RepID=UPI00083B8758|nr:MULTISPECIES: hypothetical protein [unclassified Phenylobacterium]
MDILVVLAIALLPAAGFQIGVAVADAFDPPPWLLGATLHAAAGVALAVIALELAPRSLGAGPLAPTLLAFAVGAGFSLVAVGLATGVRRIAGTRQGGLAVYAVALADLFADGLMTGAGAAASAELALLLGGSQIVANIPAGFAATAHLQDHGGGRRLRVGLGAMMSLPALAAATLGWLALRDQPASTQAVALSAVAGLLLAATVEDLIPQADRPRSPRGLSTAALAGGFVFLFWLSRASGS